MTIRDQVYLWSGMPDFEQVAQKPFAQVTVRFASEGDLREFSEIIGQKLTPKTKSIWHPYRSHFREEKKFWVREDE